ncbi:MAG: phenylalanine--tRNA ligase subunit beta [Proteobacteria bacterium]|nr:phenylalanine--tRNA ligase subunit beta [Pseudomonadota bacterium]
MRIPFEWLKDFVVIDIEPQELAKRLTMRGLEVESLEEYAPSFRNVVAGEIVSIDRHSKADNLSICTIDNGSSILPVVCGAKNISKGDKVPFAMIDARLADGAVIEKKELRGVTSFGMLCSERELGLSDDHSGIFILEDNAKLGEPLEHILGVSDVVFDISVPPNRGDCLSVYGIAREVGSILDQKIRILPFLLEAEETGNIADLISLDVFDLAACPRYVLKMIQGITIKKSPYWIRSRISKCGMRPINSIVDVTNYVMLEFGQPLHAFDYDRLRGNRIEVKLTHAPTVFRTLDGEDRMLALNDLLICDGVGPVAIAGIMGGENSEITEDTKNVALESAFFNPYFIRRTVRGLGIRSEASLRFEKGIDIDNVDFAGERAILLMHKLSGGKVVKGYREVYDKKELNRIFVSFGKINEILGTAIEQRDIVGALRSVDLHVMKEEESGFLVSIPPFRYDINEYIDIIEEIARIHGYEHIPATTPVTAVKTLKRDKKENQAGIAKDYFKSAGFNELINFAFFSVKDIENFFITSPDERASCVNIMNPISKDYEVMRTFIAAGVLKNIAYNLNRGAKSLRFFESGKVFYLNTEGLPVEYPAVCFAMTGREREYFWRDKYPEYDFFDIKGVLEGLVNCFGLDIHIEKSMEPFLNPNKSGDVFVNNEKAGWIGEIKAEVLKFYEIEQKVYCAELRFDVIWKMSRLNVQYTPIPKYPQVTRDFTFLIADKTPVSHIIEKIKGVSPLIIDVGVFDMFKKEVRSVSFRVVFQSFEDTLKDETVNALQDIIIKEVTNIDGVMLRG